MNSHARKGVDSLVNSYGAPKVPHSNFVKLSLQIVLGPSHLRRSIPRWYLLSDALTGVAIK